MDRAVGRDSCVDKEYAYLMGREQGAQVNQNEKPNRKQTENTRKARQPLRVHLSVRNNTWAGPLNPIRCQCDGPGGEIRTCDGLGRVDAHL